MQPRFYCECKIENFSPFIATKHIQHHIQNVLRLKDGSEILCFDNRNEWICKIKYQRSKVCFIEPIRINRKIEEQKVKIHLFLSIIKNDMLKLAISNATQIGVSTIQPIITERSPTKNINVEKLNIIAQQASAQCNRIDIPEIKDAIKLNQIIEKFNFPIICGSEACARNDAKEEHFSITESIHKIQNLIKAQSNNNLENNNIIQIAALIGPEGGFTKQENDWFQSNSNNISLITLGKNILRTEIATVAILQTIKIATALQK